MFRNDDSVIFWIVFNRNFKKLVIASKAEIVVRINEKKKKIPFCKHMTLGRKRLR